MSTGGKIAVGAAIIWWLLRNKLGTADPSGPGGDPLYSKHVEGVIDSVDDWWYTRDEKYSPYGAGFGSDVPDAAAALAKEAANQRALGFSDKTSTWRNQYGEPAEKLPLSKLTPQDFELTRALLSSALDRTAQKWSGPARQRENEVKDAEASQLSAAIGFGVFNALVKIIVPQASVVTEPLVKKYGTGATEQNTADVTRAFLVGLRSGISSGGHILLTGYHPDGTRANLGEIVDNSHFKTLRTFDPNGIAFPRDSASRHVLGGDGHWAPDPKSGTTAAFASDADVQNEVSTWATRNIFLDTTYGPLLPWMGKVFRWDGNGPEPVKANKARSNMVARVMRCVDLMANALAPMPPVGCIDKTSEIQAGQAQGTRRFDLSSDGIFFSSPYPSPYYDLWKKAPAWIRDRAINVSGEAMPLGSNGSGQEQWHSRFWYHSAIYGDLQGCELPPTAEDTQMVLASGAKVSINGKLPVDKNAGRFVDAAGNEYGGKLAALAKTEQQETPEQRADREARDRKAELARQSPTDKAWIAWYALSPSRNEFEATEDFRKRLVAFFRLHPEIPEPPSLEGSTVITGGEAETRKFYKDAWVTARPSAVGQISSQGRGRAEVANTTEAVTSIGAVFGPFGYAAPAPMPNAVAPEFDWSADFDPGDR